MQNANISRNVDLAFQNLLNQPPRVAPVRSIDTRVQDFFAALEIGHPANRAKVATAIAHTMTKEQLTDAQTRLMNDRQQKIDQYTKLNAPDCLIAMAEKTNAAALGIVRRVLAKR